MTQARHFFSTPLLIDRLHSQEAIKAQTEAIMTQKVRDTEGVQISNIGSWHSNTRMIEWGGEAARALVYKAIGMADAGVVNIAKEQGREYGWVPEMWANVSQKGHANQYHTHPGSLWSAVAYLDDGYEGSADPALGGELQLLDPRMPMVRMGSLDLRFKDADGEVQNNEPMIRPQTGLIVMFPSWLQHSVRAFRGTGTRISVAINLVPALRPPKS
ncbi:MAG: 2OG-Fe(II) oxygenase family protein [Erythrobacter sp.]